MTPDAPARPFTVNPASVRRFRRYPEYKDSGVEWLGAVPVGWGVEKLKYNCTYNDDSLNEDTNPNYLMNYVDIQSVDFISGIKTTEEFRFEKSPSRARRIVKDGDIIVSTVRTYLKAIAPINNPQNNLIVSTGFAVIRPKMEINNSFAGYLLRCNYFIAFVVSHSEGVSYPAINSSELVKTMLPIPPLPEQRQIADFLDRETQNIDSLIAKKKGFIELLEEKRTSLISHAVTKGLDPDSEMKDSGVEWLGAVPVGWDVKKLKYAAKIIAGQSPHESTYNEKGIGSILINGPAEYSNSDFGYTKEIKWTTDPIKWAKKDSLLFCLRGSTTGRLNIAHDNVSIGRGVAAIIALFNQNYLNNFMISMREYIIKTANGSTYPSITSEYLSNYKISLPYLPEQRQIADFLDRETQNIDKIIEKTEEQIIKLEEYRTALISAAVTGKIDVREEASA